MIKWLEGKVVELKISRSGFRTLRATVGVLLGIGLFSFFLARGWADATSRLSDMRIEPLIGAVLATIGITVTISIRWGMLANALGGRRVAAWHQYYGAYLLSRTAGFFIPKDIADIGGRSLWLTKKRDMSAARATISVLSDRLLDLIIMAVFLLGCLPYWLGWASEVQALILMIVLGLGSALVVPRLGTFLQKLRLSSQLNESSEYRERLGLSEIRTALSSALGDHVVLSYRLYLLSLVKFGLTALRFGLFAEVLNLPISLSLILLAMPIGQLSYLLAFTPGGLGIYEAGWYGLLVQGGVLASNAMIFVVGQRILTFAIVLVLTITSQILLHLQTRTISASIGEVKTPRLDGGRQ